MSPSVGNLGPTRFIDFCALAENSPDAILVVDLAGTVQFANAKAVSVFGAGEATALLGVQWCTLWPDEEGAVAQSALEAAARGETERFPASVDSEDAGLRRLDNILSPLGDDSRSPSAVLVTSRDVTDLEEARLAAQARESSVAHEASLLRSVADMAYLTTWEHDLRRNLITTGEVGMRGGPDRREITFEQALAMHTPENQALIQGLMEQARVSGEPFRIDLPTTRHDGTRGWTRQFAEPVYEGDSCVGFRGGGIDITDEVKAREAVERAQQRLNLAAQLAGMEVYEVDFDNQIVLSGGASGSIFGRLLRYDDVWPDLLSQVDPRDRDRVLTAWVEAQETRSPFRGEFRVTGPDGREVWIFAVAEIIRTQEGPRRLLTAIMDITERKRGELQMLQTMAQMREHEAHQKLLLDELNHRVKNTLASVQSVAMQSLTNERDLQEGRNLFIDRLLALSNTHNLLVKHAWTSASFQELAKTALQPYGQPYGYEGPDLSLDPNFAVSLGMALHELATNALKHGAWRERGQVLIATAADEAEVRITWREIGGPPVSPPTRRGFGSRLLQRGVAGELGGKVELNFHAEGLVCSIQAPTSGRLRAIPES